MAEIALRNIERRAKHKVTRPEIKVGNMVWIRVKPIESRGSYRVNEIAWSEKVYRVVSAESGEMGARFGLKEMSEVAALQAPATRSQRAELALRWFEAHNTWSGR